jgi:hypothetical protein
MRSETQISDAYPKAEPKEPLQIRIPVSIKRRFKAHAAMRGVEPNELFVEIWRHYEAQTAQRGGTKP